MKKVVEDGTSSGPIVAASVNDPQSPEAAFVPFLKWPFKKSEDEKDRRKAMNRIIDDVRKGMMDEAREAIGKILSESCSKELSEAGRRRTLRECKGNKEEFQKWLELKKENARRKKQGLPPLKEIGGTTAPAKPSAKDRFKALMLKRKSQNGGASAAKPKVNEASCAACGASCGDDSMEVGGKAYCRDCGRKAKLKRISEAVKRMEEAAGRKLDESGGMRNVFSEFVRHAEADHTLLGAKVRNVINQDLFNGVFADGSGHGYVEHGSGKGLPDYARRYAMNFVRNYGKAVSEAASEDFSRELALFKRSYERHHGKAVSEAAAADSTGDVVVGIEVFGDLIDGRSEVFKKAAGTASEKYGMNLAYDEGSGKAFFGLSLVDDQKLTVDGIKEKVDRCSAAFVSDLEELGVDVSKFDSDVRTVAIGDGAAGSPAGNLVVGVEVDGLSSSDAIFRNLEKMASSKYGARLFSGTDGQVVFGLSVIDDPRLSISAAEEKMGGKLDAFSSDVESLGLKAGSEVQVFTVRD